MRLLGIDYGRRRIGLSLSDPSGILASPWRALQAGSSVADSVRAIADIVDQASREDDPIAEIVIGLPRRLTGEDTDQTTATRVFGDAVAARTGLRVHFQDERLTSREAESLLATRERDWRRRKERLDATAAAIILQDFIENRSRLSARTEAPEAAE